MRIKRIGAGVYEMGDYTVTKTWDEEGWIVASKTDKYDYSDPIPTLREAKKSVLASVR